MAEFGNKSSAEIGGEIDQREKDLQTAIKALSTIEQEILILQRQIIDLQGKKKDLELSQSKASQNMKVISSTLRQLKLSFWAAKNGGL